jgi:hypothetical protein
MGQGTLSFSKKKTQTLFLTFDWRSENEHQEPASRLGCGPRRSLRRQGGRCRRRRRAGADGIRARLRRVRHRLLLHARHRDLPEDHSIRYTFDAGNGIAVSVALEEEDNNFDYVPLVVGKVSVAQGWGSFDVFAAYDDRFSEFALKGVAKIKATDALTLELLAAYESGATWFGLADFYAGYEWSVGGYLKYAVNDRLTVGAGAQYFADSHFGNFITNTTTEVGNDDWSIGAVIDYKVVENLNAKLAVNYDDGDSFTDGSFNGFLRLDASF